MRHVRGKRIAMILQDPMASLNPLFTIGDQVAEPIRVHEGAGRATAWSRACELLKSVRIPSPQTRLLAASRTRCRAACASASSAPSASRASRAC